MNSLRSWRDFARESFCFGSEAVNESGEAVRGLVKSPVEFPPAQIRGVFLIMRPPVDANFGLAESTSTSTSHLSLGKRFVFIHRFAMDNAKKCKEEALNSLNIRWKSRKIMKMAEQERAVRVDLGE